MSETTERRIDASVVLPVFNAEDFLPKALEALLLQTHDAFEIIVVDDASTDASAAIAAQYSERDHRVRCVRMPRNAGVAAARELGVQHAQGDYVWFVDADDSWTTDAIATLVATAHEFDADCVCARARTVMSDGTIKPVASNLDAGVLSGVAALRLFLRGQISGHLWNKLFRRQLLLEIEFTRSAQHSDQAMVAQALAAASTVALSTATTYFYTLRNGSIIRSPSRRAESLDLVSSAVKRALKQHAPHLSSSREYDYYQARFELLSRLKDATAGAYSAADAARLVAEVRSRVRFADLSALLQARDFKRVTLLTSAVVSRHLYQALMRTRGTRD